MWGQLALACDSIAKQKEDDAAEMERLKNRR